MAGKRKTTAKRGRSKQVIDYDPLAWLEEPQGEAQATAEAEPAELETAPDRPAAVDADAGYGFFDDAPVSAPEASAETATEEDSGFGFFEAPQAEDGEAGDDTAADEGYGFFDAAPGTPEASGSDANAATADADESAYGFFDDAPTGSAREPWKDDDAVIHLGTELAIRNVQQAHALIAEALSGGFDLRIDAGDLQKIDSAGLQMIYSLRMTLEKTGQSIRWERGSALIDSRAAELGLPPLVGESADATEDNAGYGFF